jgi:hypothetical protein
VFLMLEQAWVRRLRLIETALLRHLPYISREDATDHRPEIF